jgi:DNA-binding XRE family transcriptional regulator
MLVGTNAENMADRNGRGRQMRYERMWKSKLTQDGVREIRALRASGMTLRQLAQRYGVWRTTIESVLYGKTWKGISLWAK